jgi:hypothetical protein
MTNVGRWGRRSVLSTPLTVAYLIVLLGSTAALSLMSPGRDDSILGAVSTNLHQLTRVPIRVLVGSALWRGGWADLARTAALFLLILAPVELRVGWRRTLAVFSAGHVGATLVVAAGLYAAIRAGIAGSAVEFARDVGVSYGLFAVAAFASHLIEARRSRLCYIAALTGYLAFAAAAFHTFTDFGHLAALLIGLACYGVLPRHIPAAGERSTQAV